MGHLMKRSRSQGVRCRHRKRQRQPSDHTFLEVRASSDSALCFPQYFVKLLKAKGTLKKDVTESIFSSIEAIYSVNQ